MDFAPESERFSDTVLFIKCLFLVQSSKPHGDKNELKRISTDYLCANVWVRKTEEAP